MQVMIAPVAATAVKVELVISKLQSHFPSVPVALWGWGFAGAEVVTIEVPNRVGADVAVDAHWDAWKVGTVAQVLSAENNKIDFLAPGRFRLSKTANTDANAIGCAVM